VGLKASAEQWQLPCGGRKIEKKIKDVIPRSL
jgi:hypothetical protein